MSAALTLSALRVLDCEIGFSSEGRLKINSPNVPLSGSFLSLIKQYKTDISSLENLRCPSCNKKPICEEGISYTVVYCPNGCAFMDFVSKGIYTQIEALADWQQIQFEAQERLALMTEDGRNETDALNEISQQIILDLFTNGKAYE